MVKWRCVVHRFAWVGLALPLVGCAGASTGSATLATIASSQVDACPEAVASAKALESASLADLSAALKAQVARDVVRYNEGQSKYYEDTLQWSHKVVDNGRCFDSDTRAKAASNLPGSGYAPFVSPTPVTSLP